MNRLVIIGNGFDLAHGLPTRYKDFIDDFWKGFKNNFNDDLVKKILFFNADYFGIFDYVEGISDFKDFKKCALQYANNYSREVRIVDDKNKFEIYKGSSNFHPILRFNNDFFERINFKNIENWVDIENEYYFLLKEIVNEKLVTNYPNNEEKDQLIKRKKAKVIKLNSEFDDVKKLFEKYLINIFEHNYNWQEIKSNEIIEHLTEETSLADFSFDSLQKKYFKSMKNFHLEKTTLLSFNYTKTVFDYSEELLKLNINSNYNYIHGKIESNDLPIIFGFGDEMDKEYKMIEDIDDNEYIKNFKSIKYLEHSNYKNLYNFIELGPFQVFLMGHSCGLSDRTLLSTIFESEYCLSVKVFYREYLDEISGNVRDNYTEIVQNISRHFTDKKMLRKKVVEKRHCQPLIKYREIN